MRQLTITTACAFSKSTKARARFAPYQRLLSAWSRPASMRTKICSRSIRPCRRRTFKRRSARLATRARPRPRSQNAHFLDVGECAHDDFFCHIVRIMNLLDPFRIPVGLRRRDSTMSSPSRKKCGKRVFSDTEHACSLKLVQRLLKHTVTSPCNISCIASL